jgi:hypothetical protein
MTHEERRAWIAGVVSVTAYLSYLTIVLARADGVALSRVSYAPAMLWSIGGAILASILLDIAAGIAGGTRAGRRGPERDQRDREIGRFGNHVGTSFVTIGALSALLLAMAQAPYFWIANAVFLAFTLSALLGSIAKIAVYRWGFSSSW